MTEAESSSLLKGSTERTVFISYSWTPEQHRQWVLELAKRLVSHGIDVILDVWHLKPGQDKYVFMERMVTDPQVKRVLIICNRSYQEKADGRTGGVGTESQIISPEVSIQGWVVTCGFRQLRAGRWRGAAGARAGLRGRC